MRSNPIASPVRSPLRSRVLVATGCAVPLLLVGGWGGWTALEPRPDEHFEVAAVINGQTRQIQIEAFHAVGGDGSAVVLVHGVEGANRFRRSRFRVARDLARQGHSVYVVHYFDAVDYDDLWQFTADGRLDTRAIEEACLRDSEHWIAAVVATVTQLAKRPEVDSRRIAISGYSLGGFIALTAAQQALASDTISDVRAVVVNWGAKFATTDFTPGFPPTLFVHGEHDEIVPIQSARETIAILHAVQADTRLHVVEGAGHLARSPEADKAIRDFLAEKLAPPDEACLSASCESWLGNHWPHDRHFIAPHMPRF
ncbi:MAG: prolyl oligopeptidase family serine peptidase [Pirellulaceae bacterium]|nr:prolyl oligopeptidase family serine peptidase [Pirellulaceae bacterium]